MREEELTNYEWGNRRILGFDAFLNWAILNY